MKATIQILLLISTSLHTPCLGLPLLSSENQVAKQARRQCLSIINSYPPPKVASGYEALLSATGFTFPRQLVFDKQGRLLVLDRGIGIRSLMVNEDGGLLNGDDIIVGDANLNHGLTISVDGKTLFASDSDKVYAWTYDTATGNASNKKTLVTGMASGGHTTRSLLIAQSNPAMLLISVGSDGNLDQGTKNYTSGRSQIRGFNWKDLTTRPTRFNQGGANFGWGLRNSVGIRDDKKGMLWSVENSADNLARNGVDIHTDNPAEELNFHGSVKDYKTKRGNYGYPVCFAAGDASVIPNSNGLVRGAQFALNPTPSFTDATCKSQYQAPRLTFPAHSAPLDIVFDADGNAWVSLHGSWNRSPPIGYQLIRIPFDSSTGQPAAASSSANGFETIMSNANVSQCPGSCLRPTSLAVAPDGSIFMSSDATGQIYRIRKSSK